MPIKSFLAKFGEKKLPKNTKMVFPSRPTSAQLPSVVSTAQTLRARAGRVPHPDGETVGESLMAETDSQDPHVAAEAREALKALTSTHAGRKALMEMMDDVTTYPSGDPKADAKSHLAKLAAKAPPEHRPADPSSLARGSWIPVTDGLKQDPFSTPGTGMYKASIAVTKRKQRQITTIGGGSRRCLHTALRVGEYLDVLSADQERRPERYEIMELENGEEAALYTPIEGQDDTTPYDTEAAF